MCSSKPSTLCNLSNVGSVAKFIGGGGGLSAGFFVHVTPVPVPGPGLVAVPWIRCDDGNGGNGLPGLKGASFFVVSTVCRGGVSCRSFDSIWPPPPPPPLPPSLLAPPSSGFKLFISFVRTSCLNS